MGKKSVLFLVFLAVLGITVIMGGRQAMALPEYGIQTGQSCGYCHTDSFGLNSTGKEFKANGHSFSKPATDLAKPVDTKASFQDIAGHWAQEQVDFLTAEKIIAGYSDGTFRPDQTVTEAQFAELIRRVFGVSFEDAGAAFLSAYAYSNNDLNRETAAAIFLQALGMGEEAAALSMAEARNLASLARDGYAVSPAKAPYVGLGIKSNMLHGYPDKTFRPAAILTRAEAAVLVKIAYDYRH